MNMIIKGRQKRNNSEFLPSLLDVCTVQPPNYLSIGSCAGKVNGLGGLNQLLFSFACAAASLAMGTRKGEQETY